MKAEALETHSKLLEIESRLSKFAFLSKEPLPGAADALIFQKLKNSQKMPTKDKYFNFYHWFITMSQFAQREIQKWLKDKDHFEDDKLLTESLTLIEGLKNNSSKTNEAQINYIMNIFLKQPAENNMTAIKNRLLTVTLQQIGEELKINFQNYQERANDYNQNNNELRIMFKLRPSSCETLKDIVSKWPEIKNLEIKKVLKQKRA